MLLPRPVTAAIFLALGAIALSFTWTEVLRWAVKVEYPRRRKFFLKPGRWPFLLGIAFFDSILRDARESAVGSFAEATLAGPVFITFPWFILTTFRARRMSSPGQLVLGLAEIAFFTLLNWWVAPSTAIPWYIAYRLTLGRGEGSATAAPAGKNQGGQSSSEPGESHGKKGKGKGASSGSAASGGDSGVCLDRSPSTLQSSSSFLSPSLLLPRLALPALIFVVLSAALPPTLTVLGQVAAKHAAKAWMPWTYDYSHGLVASLWHEARVNDMATMLTLDASFTALACAAHTLLQPLTPLARKGAWSIGAVLPLLLVGLPLLTVANFLTAGAPWALGLALMEWGML